LTPFLRGGPYASFLDGSKDSLRHARFQVFEMRQLLDLEPKAHLPILHHILNRIEGSLEAGLALLHEAFASRINQWALTLRKKNAVLVLALQALSQLESNNSFSTLLQSCPTRIFLPNSDAGSAGIRGVYEACGLNHRQIALISSSRKKRDYYLANPDGCRLFGLALTPPELAFFGTLPGRSLQDTHAEMHRHMQLCGRAWKSEWLKTFGLPEDASRLALTHHQASNLEGGK
jgi:type IV secretion system protein VirB4